MRLVQFKSRSGERKVGTAYERGARVAPLAGWATDYEFAKSAIERGGSLAAAIESDAHAAPVRYDELVAEGRLVVRPL